MASSVAPPPAPADRYRGGLHLLALVGETTWARLRATWPNDDALRTRTLGEPDQIAAALADQMADAVLVDAGTLAGVEVAMAAVPHRPPVIALATPGDLARPDWNHETEFIVLDEARPESLARQIEAAIDRHRRDAELRRREELYRTFFENDLTADFITTPTGQVVDCNPAFVSLFGFESREHALSCNTRWIYPDPIERAELMRLLKKRRHLENIELTLCRLDGTPVHVIENILGHFDGRGRLTGLQGFIFDITDRVNLEEQLRHAQKMEVVGRLAGGVAHDFNNILTVIQGHSQMLLDEAAEGTPLRADLGEILGAANRAAALTRQLLAFSRKQVLKPTLLDVSEVIHSMHRMLERLAGSGVAVFTDFTSDPWTTRMDASQLESVVVNLVVNARDAMNETGELEIRTECVALRDGDPTLARSGPGSLKRVPGDYVMISVRDTGSGIAPDQLERIFEPFYTTKAKAKGTGLGLATVLSIAESNQGFLEVDSTVGRGSLFRVYLPRAEHLGDRARRREDSTMTPEETRGTETILVTEDEDAVRGFVARALTRAGYTVLDARDFEAAMEILNGSTPVHLLLADTVLPGRGGRQLAREASKLRPDLRVLMMSGFADDEAVQEFVANGGAFLPKPFAPDELTRAIRRTLDDGPS